jgi:hypothetical protein
VTAALRALLAPLVREAVAEALVEHDAGATAAPVLLDREGLAAALGCSVATVSRLRAEGMPVTHLLDSPRYELERVLVWLRARNAA